MRSAQPPSMLQGNCVNIFVVLKVSLSIPLTTASHVDCNWLNCHAPRRASIYHVVSHHASGVNLRVKLDFSGIGRLFPPFYNGKNLKLCRHGVSVFRFYGLILTLTLENCLRSCELWPSHPCNIRQTASGSDDNCGTSRK